MRCAILDVVSGVLGVLPQLWIDVSVRCPHADRYNVSASKCGLTASACEAQKAQRYGAAVHPSVSESYGRHGPADIKLFRDLLTITAAIGFCSPHAVGRWRTHLERVLLSAEADTSFCALGSRAAATGVLGQQAAVSPFTREDWCPPCLSFVERCVVRITCEGSID